MLACSTAARPRVKVWPSYCSSTSAWSLPVPSARSSLARSCRICCFITGLLFIVCLLCFVVLLYIYIHTYVYVYIYTLEKERERETFIYIYIYICIMCAHVYCCYVVIICWPGPPGSSRRRATGSRSSAVSCRRAAGRQAAGWGPWGGSGRSGPAPAVPSIDRTRSMSDLKVIDVSVVCHNHHASHLRQMSHATCYEHAKLHDDIVVELKIVSSIQLHYTRTRLLLTRDGAREGQDVDLREACELGDLCMYVCVCAYICTCIYIYIYTPIYIYIYISIYIYVYYICLFDIMCIYTYYKYIIQT